MANDSDQYDPLGRYQGPIGSTSSAPEKSGPIAAPAKPPLGDIGGAYQRGAPTSIGAGLGLAAREVATSPAANVIGRTVAAGATPVPSAIRAIGGQIYDAGRAFLTGEAAPTAGPLVSAANAAPSQPIAAPATDQAARNAANGLPPPAPADWVMRTTADGIPYMAPPGSPNSPALGVPANYASNGAPYSPITQIAPARTKAGPSRADRLQALSVSPETAVQEPTGSVSSARIEQYFTPPEGPIGGPLNRGGVQIQNADGTIATQEPNAVTPQIRPQAGGAPVQVIGGGPGGSNYVQHFEDGGYRVAQRPDETTEQAEERYAARAAINKSMQQSIEQGQPLSLNTLLAYHYSHGLDASHLLAAQAATEGAQLHSAATVAAAEAHAQAARYAADQTVRAGQTKEMDVPIGGTELGQGLGKPNVIKGVYDAKDRTLRSALGTYNLDTNVFTPAPPNAAPQSQTWEALKALRPGLSPDDFKRHLAGLPADELTKAKKELPAMAAGLAFETGKKYTDKNGTSAVYGGKDAAGKDIWNANTTPPPQAIEYLKKNPGTRSAFEKTYGVSADPYLQGFARGGLVAPANMAPAPYSEDEGPLEDAANVVPLPQTRGQIFKEMRRARGQQ